MTGLKTSSCIIASLALLGSIVGCAPVSTHSSGSPLLASPPRVPVHADPPEPPAIGTRLELADAPHLFTPSQLANRPGKADAIIREAEWHFQQGRRSYQDGDEEAARREFDRAVDILLSAPDDPGIKPAIDKKLEDLVTAIHRLDLSGLGAGDVAAEPGFEKPPLEDIPEMTFPFDPRLKTKVVDELRATSSQLPLQVNDTVLSYMNYFSSERGRRMLVFGLRRAGRYRPMIRRIFDEEGVPQELIYLAQAESGFLPRAVSRKSATGMWQFMASRGEQYGLHRSPYSDDRLDPEKATRAAARHLRDLYNRYGDWYLAMAAYNCGPGVIDRGVERTGYADYWELRRRNVLPRDTANYVPVILAMTIMVKNAREYGLEGIEADPAIEYDTVEISAPTHLQLIADLTESPVSQLRELNPALLKNIAPAGTSLRVPKGSSPMLASAIDKVPAERRTAWRAHRVLDGETLASIARRYRVTEASIAGANTVAVAAIEPGEVLIVPAAAEREKASVTRGKARRTSVHASAKRHHGAARIASASHGRARHSAAVHRRSRGAAFSGTAVAARRAKTVSVRR